MQRNTRQREAIRYVIRKCGRPLSVRELLVEVGIRHTGLGIATIYLTLKTLLLQEKICTVTVPGHPDSYEVSGLPHHHHFHRQERDHIYDLEGYATSVARLAPINYKAAKHHILLTGTCPSCV